MVPVGSEVRGMARCVATPDDDDDDEEEEEDVEAALVIARKALPSAVRGLWSGLIISDDDGREVEPLARGEVKEASTAEAEEEEEEEADERRRMPEEEDEGVICLGEPSGDESVDAAL